MAERKLKGRNSKAESIEKYGKKTFCKPTYKEFHRFDNFLLVVYAD